MSNEFFNKRPSRKTGDDQLKKILDESDVLSNISEVSSLNGFNSDKILGAGIGVGLKDEIDGIKSSINDLKQVDIANLESDKLPVEHMYVVAEEEKDENNDPVYENGEVKLILGHAMPSVTPPSMNSGTVGTIGTDNGKFARGDHVHPVDDSRARKNHASEIDEYGKATAVDYGHVKIVDNLTTPTDDALSANQGRILNTKMKAWETAAEVGILTVNGVDLSNAVSITKNLTSSTAAGTAIKEITAAGLVVIAGAIIQVSFTNTPTGGINAIQLNINNTGGVQVRYNNSTVLGSAGRIISSMPSWFKYDGTYWQLLNPANALSSACLSANGKGYFSALMVNGTDVSLSHSHPYLTSVPVATGTTFGGFKYTLSGTTLNLYTN